MNGRPPLLGKYRSCCRITGIRIAGSEYGSPLKLYHIPVLSQSFDERSKRAKTIIAISKTVSVRELPFHLGYERWRKFTIQFSRGARHSSTTILATSSPNHSASSFNAHGEPLKLKARNLHD